MWHTTSSGHHRTISAAVWAAAALWGVAGVVSVIALGGGLTRVAVVLAIVMTEWWLVSQLEDRFEATAAERGAKVSRDPYSPGTDRSARSGPMAA